MLCQHPAAVTALIEHPPLRKGRGFQSLRPSRDGGWFLLLTPSFRVHSAGDPGVTRPWVYSTTWYSNARIWFFRSREKLIEQGEASHAALPHPRPEGRSFPRYLGKGEIPHFRCFQTPTASPAVPCERHKESNSLEIPLRNEPYRGDAPCIFRTLEPGPSALQRAEFTSLGVRLGSPKSGIWGSSPF